LNKFNQTHKLNEYFINNKDEEDDEEKDKKDEESAEGTTD
jgi:hypothetical protein